MSLKLKVYKQKTLENPFEGILWEDNVSQEVVFLVDQNPKTLESIVKYDLRLKELNLKPENFLYKDGKLRGTQAIRNQMRVAENLALYFNPINDDDETSSKKLRTFVNEFLSKSEFTIKEVQKKLKELNPLADFNKGVLIELLKCFGEITYDKRNKKYKVKSIYEDEWVITQFFYKEDKIPSCVPNKR